MTERDAFIKSCDTALTFPKCLVYHNTYEHILDAYIERLKKEETRLFFNENRADAEFWDYRTQARGFISSPAKNYLQLKNHIVGEKPFDQDDPQSTFLFIHAQHSRERLKITKQMLLYSLTYYQVMPSFVDFLLPFGKQDYPRDFHFSGLRHETRLSVDEKALQLKELGRSGHDFRMCYNLKSVETSTSQENWQWSIRQTATYHSFDIGTGKAFWTIIKGDQLIKRRIKSATDPKTHPNLDLVTSPSLAFEATLSTHLIIFDWCGESWRWYINHIEEAQQAITRRALLMSFDRPANRPSPSPHRAATSPPTNTIKRTLTKIVRRAASATGTLTPSIPMTARPSPSVPPPDFEQDPDNNESFSFSHLQDVQFYEEKVNEALLILESNINILTSITVFYEDLFVNADFPGQIIRDCSGHLTRFRKTTMGIVDDLNIQRSRARMLLSTITDRKSLLYGVLNYRNMEASKNMAEEAQASTKHMEAMTEEMNALTHKTKQETVSMRIITLVTLFFLPGTFISTIMSTDIIQYSKTPSGASQEDFSSQALRLYLSITLPMTAVVFVAWYVVAWWVDKKMTVQMIKDKISRMPGNV